MFVNKAEVQGNVIADPIVRAFTGGSVANFTVATNESWKDKKTGEVKTRSEYHRITTFDKKSIDTIEKSIGKGTVVNVSGKLTTRKWQDKNGQDKYTTEIQASSVNVISGEKTEGFTSSQGANYQREPGDELDDIPF